VLSYIRKAAGAEVERSGMEKRRSWKSERCAASNDSRANRVWQPKWQP